MKRKTILKTGITALMLTSLAGWVNDTAYAAFDENLNTYTLDAVIVNADRTKN